MIKLNFSILNKKEKFIFLLYFFVHYYLVSGGVRYWFDLPNNQSSFK